MRYLSQDPTLLNGSDSEGQTALHWFALWGATATVEALLRMGATPSAASNKGQTPLHWAALRGNLDVVRILAHTGAELEASDRLGATPLLNAVQHAQPLAVMLLLDLGASLDARDVNGSGAAHYAAYRGNLTMLRLLYKRGARMSAANSNGATPLHKAAQYNQGDVIPFLVQHGCDPDQVDNDGQSAGALASVIHSPQAARALLAIKRRRERMRRCFSRVTLYFLDDELRDRWLFGTIWLLVAFCTAIVYSTRLMHITSHRTLVTQAFATSFTAMVLSWLRLTFGDPGRVGQHTPQYPGAPKRLGGARLSHGARDRSDILDHGRVKKKPDSEAVCFDAHDPKTVGSESDVWRDNWSLVSSLVHDTAHIPSDVRVDHICFSCELVKPVRSKHCRTCGTCHARFDHHCVWIMNCVAAGNHRLFVAFLMLQLVTLVTFLGFSCEFVVGVWSASGSLLSFLWIVAATHKLAVVTMVVNVMGALVTCALVGEQLRNAGKALTTNDIINQHRYEHLWREVTIRGRRVRRFENPFDQGVRRNCMAFWGLAAEKPVDYADLHAIRTANEHARTEDLNRHVRAARAARRETAPVDISSGASEDKDACA